MSINSNNLMLKDHIITSTPTVIDQSEHLSSTNLTTDQEDRQVTIDKWDQQHTSSNSISKKPPAD